jgi:hypothetical protein
MRNAAYVSDTPAAKEPRAWQTQSSGCALARQSFRLAMQLSSTGHGPCCTFLPEKPFFPTLHPTAFFRIFSPPPRPLFSFTHPNNLCANSYPASQQQCRNSRLKIWSTISLSSLSLRGNSTRSMSRSVSGLSSASSYFDILLLPPRTVSAHIGDVRHPLHSAPITDISGYLQCARPL